MKILTRFIVIASGKGGVGKTTTAINLGVALSEFGKSVILVDANLNTPNVGLHLGTPIVPITLHDALKGKRSILDAAYLHPSGLHVIPSRISIDELNSVNPERMSIVIPQLHGTTDVVILDGAAGLGLETQAAMRVADEMLVVTNPEIPAVTDALKVIKVAEKAGCHVTGIILNRIRNDDFEMSVENVERILERPVLIAIPDDHNVRKALVLKHPVVYTHPKASSSQHFKKLAANLLGERYDMQLEKNENSSMFVKVLRKLGLR
ncbi:septum site-determining protein MinD [Candidatus Woesearchaeota archaeon CG11_big_fil_rev_8_21_14_0_20_43_8]|nr:MAG: septum site-determining protein MinD [Candidatus Woesearchaeota archaeon CG11_big_fil_rev_8_21_14_0_20_43_8]